jgi:hypothetical protein
LTDRLEELFGVGSWSCFVKRVCRLVIVRIADVLDVNVLVHPILVDVVV